MMAEYAGGKADPDESTHEQLATRYLKVTSGDSTADTVLQVSMRGDTADVHVPEGITIGAGISEALGRVASEINRPDSRHGTPLDRAERAVSAALVFAGFNVDKIDEPTVRIEGQIDIRTGQFLARAGSECAAEIGGLDIQRRIQRVVAGVMERNQSELAAEIAAEIDAGRHVAAAAALIEGRGGLGIGAHPDLLAATLRIDLRHLEPAASTQVRRLRVALASVLSKETSAEDDARTLLAEPDAGGDRHALESFLGTVAMRRGLRDSAIARWRRVLADRPRALDRGWAWRNIALALPRGSAKAADAATASADAFLQAGHKDEAATSLIIACDALARDGVDAFTGGLRKLLGVVDAPGLLADGARAEILHLIAQRLFDFGRASESLVEAERAIAIQRGVLGLEEALVSTLNLAELAARSAGRNEDGAAFRREADSLGAAIGSRVMEQADRMQRVLRNFDREEVQAIADEMAAKGDHELEIAARLAGILFDPNFDADTKLERLEALEAAFEPRTPARTRALVTLAVADALARGGADDRAEIRLRNLLDEHPLEAQARDALEKLLSRQERWEPLLQLLQERAALFGDSLTLLEMIAVTSLKAERTRDAVQAASRALSRADLSDAEVAQFRALREMAFDRGALPAEAPAPPPAGVPVTLSQVEVAINDYAKSVSRDRRAIFWRTRDKQRIWVEQPEAVSKALFQTFMDARFGTDIEIVDEVSAGGGRLDLLLRFEGGLRVIVELKMCGPGYTSSYAAGGADQLVDYMSAREVAVGFLVVHDGRACDAGNPVLLAGVSHGRFTIKEVSVVVTQGRPKRSPRMSS